jgi:hypothetical protein
VIEMTKEPKILIAVDTAYVGREFISLFDVSVEEAQTFASLWNKQKDAGFAYIWLGPWN